MRELVEIAFAHVGLDWQQVRARRPGAAAAGRGRSADRRRRQGARARSAGSRRVDFHRARRDDGRRRPGDGAARAGAAAAAVRADGERRRRAVGAQSERTRCVSSSPESRGSPPGTSPSDCAPIGHEVVGDLASRCAAGRLTAEQLCVVDLDDRRRSDGVAATRCSRMGCSTLRRSPASAASFADPDAAYRANFHGSVHVFAAAQAAGVRGRIVWVGSSDAYGLVDRDAVPVDESTLFRPLSPYAVSKAAADLAAFQWARARGARHRPRRARSTIPVPGSPPSSSALTSRARWSSASSAGGRRSWRSAISTWCVTSPTCATSYAPMQLAWERGERGEAYNVCSGIGRTPRDIARELLRLAGIDATRGRRSATPASRRRAGDDRQLRRNCTRRPVGRPMSGGSRHAARPARRLARAVDGLS